MVNALVDHERLLRSALSSELRRWGGWIERNMLDHDDGWPSENFLLAFTHGRGGAIAGHRVLCRDMPEHIYATHRHWLSLPEQLQEAVWIRYVPMLRGDGTVWTLAEKCRLADIPLDTVEKRLARARSILIAMAE